MLSRAAETGSRELFLLAVLTLGLGTALVTSALGLSLAFGAFMAGLVISESDFSHQVLAEVIPLRDIFSSVFFVSVGMLINPLFLATNLPSILLVVAAIVVGKLVICTVVPLLFHYPGRDALLAGLALAQIGEFSFVLTRLGQDKGIIDAHLSSLILAAALVSILVNPLLMHFGGHIHTLLKAVPIIGRLFWERFEVPATLGEDSLEHHVVICGYGRVGKEMARVLDLRGEPYVVVEMDPFVVKGLRRSGKAHIYGDAANPPVLAHARVSTARLVAATLPDVASVEMVVRYARRMNPSVSIIARVHGIESVNRVLSAGADEVVCPEFEAGLEFVRHAMAHFGVPESETDLLVTKRRAERDPRLPD